MTAFTLSGVAIGMGDRALLRDVNLNVRMGDRWGVLGRNGTGKTTLLRLVAGQLEPDEGTVARKPGLRVSLLDQHRDFGDAECVWEAAAQGYRNLLDLERRLEALGKRMGHPDVPPTEEEVARYGELQEEFEHAGGYTFHARVDAVLTGLGFHPRRARKQPIEQLSGGERGRLALAAAIAAPADVLLLDEPTNHLDLQTIDWLRQYLQELSVAVLVVSHDRSFLEEFADHILHLEEGTAHAYGGRYSDFLAQRARERLTRQRQAEAQARLIAQEEDFIRRNIAGQKSAQARSRRRRLARLPRLSPPPDESEAMALRFGSEKRSGERVLEVTELSVAVPGRILVEPFSAVVRRGEIVALVGANGAGKSTLLATLLGERPPRSGAVRRGAGVVPAWFRQENAHLPLGKTLYDCVAAERPSWHRGQIQSHLGRFGFSGDAVRRKTDSLSGGERARMALALITLADANLLALDEPTNHLDVESVETLEDAFEEYEGTALLISHDRALLSALATRVWSLEDGRLHDYPGTFADWEAEARRKAAQRERAQAEERTRKRDTERARTLRRVRERKREELRSRELRMALARAEDAVQQAEEEIARLEAALAEESLHDGTAEGAREAGRLKVALSTAQEKLEERITAWEEAAVAWEAFRLRRRGAEPSGRRRRAAGAPTGPTGGRATDGARPRRRDTGDEEGSASRTKGSG